MNVFIYVRQIPNLQMRDRGVTDGWLNLFMCLCDRMCWCLEYIEINLAMR